LIDTITIHHINEVFVRIETSRGVCREISDFFSYFVPGYQHMPKFRNGWWDGKIRLFDMRKNILYKGLIKYLYAFAKERDYEVINNLETTTTIINPEHVDDFIDDLKLPFEVRGYQKDGFLRCVENERAVILSPTASGKSLMIYMLMRWYNMKTLVVVPTIGLVQQMKGDFEDYGFRDGTLCITGKTDKKLWTGTVDSSSVVTTWQSIAKQPSNWFDQFGVIIGDEAHHFKSDSLQKIMSKTLSTAYKFAFTGTLDGSETHRLMIESLFGSVFELTTSRELMDDGFIAPLDIKIILFKHKIIGLTSKSSYFDERDFIVDCDARNRNIIKLARKLKGNTIILYSLVDRHGKVLYDILNDSKYEGRRFFISGGTDAEQREQVRVITEDETDAIIIASYGTFSTGTNIKNLSNIIFASPHKGKIRVLQSIGRVLRLHDAKSKARLFDLADDLRKTKRSKPNFTLKHLYERVKIYNEQQFDYQIFNIEVGE